MFTIVTTRFNNDTWQQNENYRNKFNFKGCIYGVQHCMSPKIFLNSYVFVIEMNNSINKIEGIGLVKNNPNLERKYIIYDDPNYNRFVYKGKYRLNRDELILFDNNLVEILDYICFKEKTHLKRGSGFTKIPDKLFKHRICDNKDIKNDIRNIFLRNFTTMNAEMDELNELNECQQKEKTKVQLIIEED